MKTTLERRKETFDRNGEGEFRFVPKESFREDDNAHRWAATCATAGAAVWAGIAVLARMGIARLGAIELLFLFAPLVIVPLGMELGRVLGGHSCRGTVGQGLQPG